MGATKHIPRKSYSYLTKKKKKKMKLSFINVLPLKVNNMSTILGLNHGIEYHIDTTFWCINRQLFCQYQHIFLTPAIVPTH